MSGWAWGLGLNRVEPENKSDPHQVKVTLSLDEWDSILDLADRGADICDAFDVLKPLREQLDKAHSCQ